VSAVSKAAGEHSKEAQTLRDAIKAQTDYRKSLQAQLPVQAEIGKQAREVATTENEFVKQRIAIMDNYYTALKTAEAQKQTDLLTGLSLEEAEEKKIKAIDVAAQRAYTSLQVIGDEFGATMKNAPLWSENLQEVSANIEKIEKIGKGIGDGGDTSKDTLLGAWLGGGEEGEQKAQDVVDIAQGAADAVSGIGDAMVGQMQKAAQEAIAEIDAALAVQKEQIEAARQAQLEAEGFAEASSQEGLQKQLDAAMESGDQVLQYNLKRRMQEKAINDKYDAEAKAAEEKAAHDKAAIQYKADKAAYAMDIVNATNSVTMAVLKSMSAGWPVAAILAALAGAAGAMQLGLLLGNPPKPPAFASGGFVPGRKSDGDTQPILATAGELILNQAQQENVAGNLTGGGGNVTQVIELYIDGVMMGKAVARVLNNEPMLRARAILD
jgi:hypothetical protein